MYLLLRESTEEDENYDFLTYHSLPLPYRGYLFSSSSTNDPARGLSCHSSLTHEVTWVQRGWRCLPEVHGRRVGSLKALIFVPSRQPCAQASGLITALPTLILSTEHSISVNT